VLNFSGMKAYQLERAAYVAAHAILAANTGAPELACPGARRSHAVDTIADIIKGVFEPHCEELAGATVGGEPIQRHDPPYAIRRARAEKILPFRAKTACMD